jgi:hypothetical protein
MDNKFKFSTKIYYDLKSDQLFLYLWKHPIKTPIYCMLFNESPNYFMHCDEGTFNKMIYIGEL